MSGAELMNRIGIGLPILQAPMAGVTTPAMAAAVSGAGALGALGLGALDPVRAGAEIAALRALTSGPVNLNFFCHQPTPSDPATDAAWISRAGPLFQRFGAPPPPALREIYASFLTDDSRLKLLLEARPAVASFHFGLPRPDQIAAMRAAGIVLIASATSLDEALAIRRAGFDAVIAQGWEAGGHRGIFDPGAADERLSTEDLTRRLARQAGLPVIAAGGIMNGAGIARALGWGAVAAQLGTAFVLCPESLADAAYRARLAEGGETVMTAALSGRPARCLTNRFTEWTEGVKPEAIPAYPYAYDLAKSLNAAALAAGVSGYGAQWSGRGAGQARSLPGADLVAVLARELAAA